MARVVLVLVVLGGPSTRVDSPPMVARRRQRTGLCPAGTRNRRNLRRTHHRAHPRERNHRSLQMVAGMRNQSRSRAANILG